MSLPQKKRLTLAEVLEHLDYFTEDEEKGPMKSETTIFVASPEEVDKDLSKEDSGDEDCTEFDINKLGRKLLSAEAEACQYGTAIEVKQCFNNELMSTIFEYFYVFQPTPLNI